MFSMREAFTVGIVLTAKDMYSSVMSKAQRDIDILAKTSQAQADKFTRSLATYQKIGGIGVAMTMAGAEVSKLWEDAVATAGRNQANIDRVMIQMGDSSDEMRSRVSKSFHEIKTVWGFTDDAISESLKELSGRLGSNNSALQAINSVSAFARARNIDLAESARMLTTIYNQYGSQMDSNLSIDEKYTVSANKMDYVLKKLGGDWESIYMFLGNAGLKAKASGQGLDELLAAVSALGTEGARLRTSGASMISMLDDMVKIRKQAGWQEFFPTYKKSGSLLDMISDLRKAYSDKGWMSPGIENQQKRLDSLAKHFGANAEMVDLFIQKFDLMKKAEDDLKALGKETGNTSTVMQKANANMETWDGTVQRFNARMEEFKEMLGSGGIPMIKLFHSEIGKLTDYLETNRTAKGIAGITATSIGLGAEVAKLTGPILSLIALYGIWRTQSALSALVLGKETVAVSGLAAALGLLGKAILIIGSAYAGWTFAKTHPWLFNLLHSKTRKELQQFKNDLETETEVRAKLANKQPLSDSEKGFFIKQEAGRYSQFGATPEDIKNRLGQYGFSKSDIDKYYFKQNEVSPANPQTLTPNPQTPIPYPQPSITNPQSPTSNFDINKPFGKLNIKKYASGGYVPRDTLGLLHAGEFVLPRSLVRPSPLAGEGKGEGKVINLGGITINLSSSGSTALDAHNLARLVLNEINKSLKFDTKRFA